MEIEFRNLSYTIQNHFGYGKKKIILKNVNGKFYPRQLCAILGPSGAGKTTLLHALSGYKTNGVSGDLLINGKIRNEDWFKSASCYLSQENRLPLYMSVQEAMMLAAHLRIPHTMSTRSKEEAVSKILKQLSLQNTKETSTELLSGGQKRRLSIALELLNNPPVFFLDEPTSGLDDVSAKHMMQLLRKLALENRTVVITVHQPSALFLQNFHRMYVVADGQCVYQGTPQILVSFLDTAGFPCPTTYNPADYIIELADNEKASNNISRLCSLTKNGLGCKGFSKSFPEVDFSHLQENSVADICSGIKLKELPKDGKIHFVNPQWYQFIILVRRVFRQTVKNKNALILQTCHYVIFALLLGSVYYGNGYNAVLKENTVKIWITAAYFFGTSRLFSPVILFPSQVDIAKKEHFNRWYGLGPYYMAVTIGELPVHLFFNFIFMIITLYLTSIPMDIWRFLMYILISNLGSLTAEGMGFAIGTTFNVLTGSVLAPLFVAPFLGLAVYGFDFAQQIPAFMKILMLTSPVRCNMVAFTIITFGFTRKPLQCSDIFCAFTNPKILLHRLDMSEDKFHIEMAALIGSLVFYRLLAYFGLRRRFAR